MGAVRQPSASTAPGQRRPPGSATRGGSTPLVAQLALLQRTIGNQATLRLLAPRHGPRLAIQRYTEEDVQTRAQRIYLRRTGGKRPPDHTDDKQVQVGEKADWTQARRELDWIERRAHAISEKRKDQPLTFPADAGPMSDWLTAEQEFEAQTAGATATGKAEEPATTGVTDPSLKDEVSQLHDTIGKDMIAWLLGPYVDNPVQFANLRGRYKQRFGSDVVSDVIARHPFVKGGLLGALKKALDQSDGAGTAQAVSAISNDRSWIKEIKVVWALLYGGTLEQEVRLRLAAQREQLARALFLLLGPSAADPTTTGLRASVGVPTAATAVDGGTVTASTGVEIRTQGGTLTNMNNAFGFKYSGTQAPMTRWVQFIWREVQIHKPGENMERQEGVMRTSGGEYALTSTAQIASGQWVFNVDVKEESETPYYEDTGAAIRTSNMTAIYDQPSAGYDNAEVVSRLGYGFPAGTTLTQIAHFDTFLTREAQTLFRYGLTVTDSWIKQTASRYSINQTQTRVHNIVLQQPANAIPPEFHGALKQRFPKFEFLTL